MLYAAIPNTALVPSVLCFGTTMIGSTIDQGSSFQLLDAFVEAGGTFIDTAKVYADWLPGERSISEKTVGEWLRRSGKRSQIVLATKGAHPELSTMQTGRLSRAEIIADLDASLRHLQTDVVDLYWLHRDDAKRPVADILASLESQVRAGKIRYYGCSNWRVPRIAEAQALARREGWAGFAADQMMWSLAAVDPAALPDKTMVAMDDELKRFHLTGGMAATPYSAQANGYFQRLAAGTTDKMNAGQQRVYGSSANKARLARAQQLAATLSQPLTAIVLGYLTAQPFPTFPIFACRTMPQLQDTLQAGDVMLTQEQVAFLEQG